MLTIATTHTQARYALPQVIAKFKKAFPNVRLVLHQASPKEIVVYAARRRGRHRHRHRSARGQCRACRLPLLRWEHASSCRRATLSSSVEPLTLEAVAEWPIITYDEGFTGRTRIDEAFARAGLAPEIAMSALDADVIKTYVELGLGVGIIASMAFDPERDTACACSTASTCSSNTSSLAIRRGRFLRGYVYRFIELCSPQLTENVVRGAQAASPGADSDWSYCSSALRLKRHVPVPRSVSLLERQTNMRPCMAN